MTIFIRTSGGGGIVLLLACVLIFGRGGGPGGMLAVALLGMVALVVLAVLVTLFVLVRRLLPPRDSEPRAVVRGVVQSPGPSSPPWGTLDQADGPRALDAPVRLPDDQLEQLAELIRRGEQPQ